MQSGLHIMRYCSDLIGYPTSFFIQTSRPRDRVETCFRCTNSTNSPRWREHYPIFVETAGRNIKSYEFYRLNKLIIILLSLFSISLNWSGLHLRKTSLRKELRKGSTTICKTHFFRRIITWINQKYKSKSSDVLFVYNMKDYTKTWLIGLLMI